MVEKEEAGGGISEEEAAQYDRQIRLWGLEAQKRLRASRVLLVGMKGLGAEIAKNLILAGVKGLTMLDHEQVSPEDPRAQFLIRTGSVGRNRAEASLERAQNLNPMVDVKVDTEDIEKKPESFFTQFDAVCLTCCSRDVIVKVDQICHKNSIKFFTGDVFGYHGYTFANLGEHEFVEEKTKVAKVSQGVEDGPDTKRAKLDSSETTMVKKKVVFCPVKEALEVDWSTEKAKAALKRTTSDYFLLQGYYEFIITEVLKISGLVWKQRSLTSVNNNVNGGGAQSRKKWTHSKMRDLVAGNHHQRKTKSPHQWKRQINNAVPCEENYTRGLWKKLW
ncbi:SUMO-activating enzyme subunit 1 isoform X5 [Marmota monax]|uniref:SUMO-activating enzyme subunit 1 isoform X5 n=1 Tax=Marmota monax TaxID=9995 RepID=UPI0007625584|nr:SUMO-activating enzyme subunit 1 isoform X5 [Marmota monax]